MEGEKKNGREPLSGCAALTAVYWSIAADNRGLHKTWPGQGYPLAVIPA
jgi:hypothetical protein